jgi:hypothetical protein
MRFKHVPELAGTPAAGALSADALSADALSADDSDGSAATASSGDSQLLVQYVAEVQAAVPLVPGSEDDCCARLQRRQGFQSRDVSRTWLTFLRALGLAEETDDGFRRTRTEPTLSGIRTGLFDGVLGAAEIAEALSDVTADDPLTPAEAFDAVEPLIPRWERTRTDDWEEVWRERAGRLLDWLDALGLAERTGNDSETTPQYLPTDHLERMLADE